jgi:hypothetical protein
MLLPDAFDALPILPDGFIYGSLLLASSGVDAEYLQSGRGRRPLILREVPLLDVLAVHDPLDSHDLLLDFRDVSDGHNLGFQVQELFDEALLEVGLEEFLLANDPAILVEVVLYRLKEVGDLRDLLLHLLVRLVIHEDLFQGLELFLEPLVFLNEDHLWGEFLLKVLLNVNLVSGRIDIKEGHLVYNQLMISCGRVNGM